MQCPECVQKLQPDHLFCLHCGAVVDTPTAASRVHAKARGAHSVNAAVDIGLFRANSGGHEDTDALVQRADEAKVPAWLAAARAGSAEAQWLVSRCLRLGHGVPADEAEAGRLCERAVQQGEPLALYDLACRFDAGYDLAPNPMRAAVLFHRAAEAGLVQAQLWLAEHYLLSGGSDWEIGQAANWLEKAAAQGARVAEERLADLYVNFGARAMPHAQGVQWVMRAAERKDPDAQRALARCYAEGDGLHADPARACHWYTSAAALYQEAGNTLGVYRCQESLARLGDVEAQYLLAQFYEEGYGTPEDLREAVRWYEAAADNRHAGARARLGEAYFMLAESLNHRAGGTHGEEAVAWYRTAADAGHAQACLRLGEHFSTGEGGVPDSTQAAAWYRKAAELGEPLAQFRLGLAHAHGEGVPKNEEEAHRCFVRAADAGLAAAQFKVGVFYLGGKRLPTGDNADDAARGISYLHAAAGQGYVRAQSRLGECYANGDGVARNWEMAAKWLSKAAHAGDPRAQHLLRRHGTRL